MDRDRLDLAGIDLTGLSREDVLGALADAALAAFDEAGPAEFAFDPDEPRDRAGKWTAGGGGGSKAERSAARVERKRAEKAAARQESGLAKNRNDALAEIAAAVLYTQHYLPRLHGADGYFLGEAVRGVQPSLTQGKPLAEKSAAFRRLRDEATRVAARLHHDPAAQPQLTGVQRANALNGLREIARRADRVLEIIRREAASRHLPGVQSAQFTVVGALPQADAEFYSPDQPRDHRGRWTSGGGGGGWESGMRPKAERQPLREASLQAVRDYVRAGGEPSHVENEQLAAHLARLTVAQLHAVKAEHGLKASGKDKAALVTKLAERFLAHRRTQAPAGKRALEEAVKDRPGFHNVLQVVGGHAVRHGPTGSQVRADHAGTRFDVLTSGSTLHSSHATAEAAVKAAEQSGRFGTGPSTAEREHAARQEAMRKSRERAAVKPPPGENEESLRRAVQAETHSLESVRAGKYPVGVEGRGGRDVARARELGMYVNTVNGTTLFARTPEDARPLEEYLRAGGRAGSPEFSRLLGYTPEQIALYRRYLAASGQSNLLAEKPPAAAPPAPAGGGKAGAFDPDAAGQSLRATVERHLETLRAAGGGTSRTSPRLTAAYEAVRAEAEAAVRDVVSRAPTAAALRAVARAYGIPAPQAKSKDALAEELARAIRSRLQSFVHIHASYEGRRAGFSVVGALPPEEAEGRAALRLAEAYADRENARLRAVREGVKA